MRVFDMIIPQRNDVEHYQGSLLDLEQLRMGMAGIDAVYHLAAVANVNAVFDEPICRVHQYWYKCSEAARYTVSSVLFMAAPLVHIM